MGRWCRVRARDYSYSKWREELLVVSGYPANPMSDNAEVNSRKARVTMENVIHSRWDLGSIEAYGCCECAVKLGVPRLMDRASRSQSFFNVAQDHPFSTGEA